MSPIGTYVTLLDLGLDLLTQHPFALVSRPGWTTAAWSESMEGIGLILVAIGLIVRVWVWNRRENRKPTEEIEAIQSRGNAECDDQS